MVTRILPAKQKKNQSYFGHQQNLTSKNQSFFPVHAIKAYWGSKGSAPFILNFGTNGRGWSISRSGRFIPVKRTMVFTEHEARWAPKLVRTFGEDTNLLSLTILRTPDSNPRSSKPQSSRYIDYAIPAPA